MILQQLPWLFLTVGVFSGILFGAGALAVRHRTACKKSEQPHLQVLTFNGSALTQASPLARATLASEDLEDGPLDRLIARCEDVFPGFAQTFASAQSETVDFDFAETTTTGPISVAVKFRDADICFTVFGLPNLLARKMLMDRDLVSATDNELKTLRGTISTAPNAIWREDKYGNIDWVNAAYLDLLHQVEENSSAWPPQRLFEGAGLTMPGDMPLPRRCSVMLENGSARWFDVTSFRQTDHTLHYAVDAHATVRAEESLRNFMQTLTQTFAALPIGLAIFDRSRQLVLFNPALMDLTTLEPEWLAGRPTLYEVLNRMREKRVVPERKDFADWRRKISELETSAANGMYMEKWSLPTGQTYKITGRPHPEGAMAILIEDVSAEVSLTRKFRHEMELSQSVFDTLPEAIAVFGSDGILVHANSTYRQMWSADPSQHGQVGILDATRIWQDASLPTPLWGDVRDFICHHGDRTEWNGAVDLKSGETITCRFLPLTGGATLVGFSFDQLTQDAMPGTREIAALKA